jgi:DNA polymerase-3 subunit delta
MQVEPQELAAALQREIPPLTFVHGDETLLVEEACDLYLETARAQGYGEREIRFVESGFSWEGLLGDTQAMSLFGGRKIVDLRLVTLRMVRMEGIAVEILKALAVSNNPDTRVLLRTGELNRDQQRAAWFKALEKSALMVHVRAVHTSRFKPWLSERLRRARVRLGPEALDLLAMRMEGNLLAAVQEIERLKLVGEGVEITRKMLEDELEDSSHFNTFAWTDALLQADAERAARILRGMREEGQGPLGPLYLLVSTLRRFMRGDYLPPAQQRLLPSFRKRAGSLDAVLAECALLDLQAKGQLRGDPWESLISLSLRLCGRPMPDLAGQRRWLIR